MAKVLVLEDDQSISALIGVHVEGAGYEPVFARDVDSAWETLVAESPDCMIVDLVLAGGPDGWSFLDRVRHDGRFEHVPGVILTGLYEEPETQVRALEYNCDVLGKPFDPPVLLEKVRSLVHDAELVYGRRILTRNGKHVELMPMRVMLLTKSHSIEGTIHLPPELSRFSEGLEAIMHDKRYFIPVTEARVSQHDGQTSSQAPFLEIAKSEVIAITPLHESH